MQEQLSTLSIVVLAHQNQYYLKRCLHYLELFNFNATVLDSSQHAYRGPIPSNVCYQHLPETNYWEKVYIGVAQIKTEYVALLGVDDFYSYEGLVAACDFLSANSDYVSAAGDLIAIHQMDISKDIVYQTECAISHGIHYDHPDTEQRLLQPQRYQYPVYYTVQRTKVALKAWDFLFQCSLKVAGFNTVATRHFVELLAYIAIIIQGKHANLKTFFWLRDAYAYSASGDIEHFNYATLANINPELYSAIYHVAANIFGYDYKQIAPIIDNSLRHFSDGADVTPPTNDSSIYRFLNNNNIHYFIQLHHIIKQYRNEIVTSLNTQFGQIASTNIIYGEKWATEISSKLHKILEGKNTPLVIYGAGEHTQFLFDIFDFDNKVVAVCDINNKLWGTRLFNIPVIAPHQILDYAESVLISSRKFQNEISTFIYSAFGEQLSIITLYDEQ